MASSDVYVSFGADTGGLEAALALTKSQVQGMQRELAAMAREMRNTGVAADSELGQKMVAMGRSIADAKAQASSISSSLSGLAGGLEHTGAAASHAHTGVGFYVREIHALFDEFGSGRDRQAVGTLSNLIGTTLQSNLSLIPWAAAIGAAAAALGYLAYQSVTANNAIRSIQLDAVVAQFGLSDQAAASLIADLEKLAGVGASTAAEIAKPFIALGPAGDTIARMVGTLMPLLTKEYGDAGKAAEKTAEYFAELGTKGRELIVSTNGVTSAQIQVYDSLVAAGETGKAQAMVWDALRERYGTAAQALREHDAAIKDSIPSFEQAEAGVIGFARAEGELGASVTATTSDIIEQDSRLRALRSQLAETTAAQKTFASGLAEAFKADKVAGEIRDTQLAIDKLKGGLASGGGAEGNVGGLLEMGRALDILNDKMKKLRQEQEAGLGGGDAVSNMKQQLEIADAGFKGSDEARLQSHQAAMQKLLAGDTLTAEQRKALEVELAKNSEAIRNAANESYLRQDEAKVAAAGKNSAAVIAIRQAEVAREIEIYGAGSKEAEAAEDRLARAKERAANRGAAAASKAAKDELGATIAGLNDEVAEAEKTTRAKVALYAKEQQAKQITEAQKVALTLAALKQGETAELAALNRELARGDLSLKERQQVLDKEKDLQLDYALAVDKINEDAAAKATQAWTSTTKTINGAFESQINGLLTGAENWHQAFKNVLKDLTEQTIKFFLNWGLQQVENTAKSIVLNNSVVTAHVTGDAAMTAADQGAGAAGALSWIGSAIRSIEASAAQTFAGVTGFMAPIIGPAAPAAGAAAEASVLAVAGGLYDSGSWSVPHDMLAGIHEGEVIIPSRGGLADQFRDIASNGGFSGGGRAVNINPTVHFGVNAIDGASAAQWMRDNQRGMMKAIDEAVRHGAHLGLRRTGFA